MAMKDNFFMYLNAALDDMDEQLGYVVDAVSSIDSYLKSNRDLASSKAFELFLNKFVNVAAMAVPLRKQRTKMQQLRRKTKTLNNPRVAWSEMQLTASKMVEKLALMKRKADDAMAQLNKAKAIIKDLTPEEAEPLLTDMQIILISLPKAYDATKEAAKLLLSLKANK